ncbi:hypothetical protein [Rhodoferax antarcticus]|nr:hypothetical protein [Rhodoferax antarcticus]
MNFQNSDFVIAVVGRPAFGEPGLVLVPKLEKQAMWSNLVKPGSSLVGFRTRDLLATIVYFEGNMHHASNLKTFEERAVCAYGRMSTSYPTVAMCADQIDSLEVIGTLTQRGMTIDETPAFKAWVALDKSLQGV